VLRSNSEKEGVAVGVRLYQKSKQTKKQSFKKQITMNNIIRTSVTAIALLLTVSAAQAKGTSLAYSRTANAQIGITAGNQVTVGSIYKITDASGKVVFQGRIKSRNTFYIPTNKLANGSYTFSVDGYQLQDFSLNN